jgi:hypothetical protein
MMDRYGRSPSSDISEARIMTVDRRPKHPHAPQAALASVGWADVVVEAFGDGDRVLPDLDRVGMLRADPVERPGLLTASGGFRPVQYVRVCRRTYVVLPLGRRRLWPRTDTGVLRFLATQFSPGAGTTVTAPGGAVPPERYFILQLLRRYSQVMPGLGPEASTRVAAQVRTQERMSVGFGIT